MRSPADTLRRAAEWLLRAVALGILAWVLARAFGLGGGAGVETAAGGDLPAALKRWSTVVAPTRVAVRLDSLLVARERDWLAALPRAGTVVIWGGAAAVPTALALEPAVDPAGGLHASVAAASGANIVLADELGPLDSATGGGATTRFRIGSQRATLTATVAGSEARAVVRDSLTLRPLLLLGEGGWESKFVAAALEERGWKLVAHLVVSPKGRGDVTQGEIPPIDTSRYAAVLALDSTAARHADRLRRYVASGGGLVLWPEAAASRGLAPLAAGRSGARVPEAPLAPTDSVPRTKLALRPITDLRDDALPLERRGDRVAVAARRIEAGRVVQIGYEDLWRWRLHGDDAAPEAHRVWLNAVVGGVAYTGRRTLAAPYADEAPLATLVARLGPPAATPPVASRPWSAWLPWLFALLLLALFVEWASRRFRGAK